MNLSNNLLINTIRTSSFINEMYEAACDDVLLGKFINLSKKYKDNFISVIDILTKLDKTELTDKEKVILQKYNSMMDDLTMKCKNKQLNNDEAKSLLHILASFIIENGIYQQEFMNSYLNNYFFNGKIFFNGEELILLNSYILNFFNQMINTNIKLKYTYSNFIDAQVVIKKINEIDAEIYIAKDIYLELLKLDVVSTDDFYYLLVYQTFAMLHEFYHSMQLDTLIFNKSNYPDIERLEKENSVLLNNKEFYHDYHNNFKMEQQADKFAIEHIKYLLKDTIPVDMLNHSLDKLVSQIKSGYENNLEEEKFKALLDNEYQNIKPDLKNNTR